MDLHTDAVKEAIGRAFALTGRTTDLFLVPYSSVSGASIYDDVTESYGTPVPVTGIVKYSTRNGPKSTPDETGEITVWIALDNLEKNGLMTNEKLNVTEKWLMRYEGFDYVITGIIPVLPYGDTYMDYEFQCGKAKKVS